MSLKAPFVDFSGRKKSVHDDDNINMLASSETAPANIVGSLDSSPLFDLPLNDVGPARSVWTGAPADDAPRSTATEPTGTGTAGTLVSSASNDATTLIAPGATVELSSAYSGIVSFAGATGTLKIDNSSSFSGTITGQLAIGDVIDLADITAGANAKISYSGNDSSGMLTVSDGTNTASIALKGNYSLADFAVSSDGRGGTNIVDPPTVAGFAIGANGLPVIAPQSNSRVIYVSSSTGSDSNTGLSPNSPLKTIAAGEALLRNGDPDQLLLKAGDTFVNQSFGYLNSLNGQSATAPMLFGTYGTGAAPIVETNPNQDGGAAIGANGKSGNFVVVEGINFYAYTRDPNNAAYAGPSTDDIGAGWFNPNVWVMFAGDTFNYYSNGMIFNSGSSATTSSTVTLYRNVVTNSWSTTQHSQGVYASAVGNLVIEDNIFDHNGWNATIPGAQANIFNRNVYLNGNNGPVTFVGNISANSSSEGLQARSGGTVSGNLFVQDSAGFSVGENPGTSQTPFSTLTSTVVTGNVVINSNDIQAASGLQPRSDGIIVDNASGAGVQVTGNIIADPIGQIVNQSGISLNSNVTGVVASNNIIYGVAKNPVLNNGTGNTTSGNVINGSGYFDPTRSVETYDANVLGGPGTLTDFLAQAEANPSNPALTAAAVNAYIEAGFALVVEQVTASPTSGVELPGNTITLSLKFGQAVTVTGAPTLTLNDGGTATYTGGSGTSALTFSYTVGATDNTVSALAITQANLPSGATITDTTGNPVNLSGAAVTFSGLQIDPPSGPKISSVVESPSNGDLNAGNTVTFTLNMAGAVTVAGGTPTLTLNDGGTATYTGGSGTSALTFSYTVAAGQNAAALSATAVNLNSATVNDGSGNPANFSLTGLTQNGPQIDTSTPSVSSVVTSGTGISSGSGDVGVGTVVTLTLNMSEAVTVAGGIPTLTLNDGGTATYSGGSGSNALTFSYTVGAGQNTSDLAVTAFNSNSATVKDGAGNAANLTGVVTSPSGTLLIDTTTPSVSSVVASGTGITAGSGDLGVGKVVTLTLNMSEAVTVAGGTPTLTLNDGGTASYTGGSGTNALSFSYTVGAGQNTSDLAVSAVNLNSATVKNGAGTAASLTGAVTSPSGTLQIDTSTPSVASVVTSGSGISSGSGDLGVGSVVTLTVNMSEAVTVAGGTPTLTLNDGGTASYTGGSGTAALTFSYTVGAGQNTSDLAVSAINLNSATVKNGAGTAGSLTGAVTNPSGTLQISTTGPTVSSVVASGTGITAGSGDLGIGSIVTLTVNLSSAVTVAGGTPTLTLNDGGTATYSGGSGSNALTFNYTVGAGQNTSDLAVTAFNSNSATVKDGAGNAANLTGVVTSPSGTLLIDTTTPSVSSVVASGTGITAGSGDLGVGKVVTLTLNMSEAVTVAGGTPTLTLNDGGTASYTGGSGTNALTFSYTVGAGQNTSDLAVTAFNSNSATVEDGAGNVANLAGVVTSPSGTLQIDTTTPTLSSISETPANGHLKAGKTIALTLTMSEAVTVAGGTPTLTLNDGAIATYTGGSGTNALTFSYTVGAGQNVNSLAATAINLNGATVKNGAGTAASFPALSGLSQVGAQIDTLTPAVMQVVASPGTGTENPGDIVTLTLTMSEAVTVTGTPTLTLNDGGTATYTSGSGTNALTFSYTVGATDSTVPTLAIIRANLPSGATVTDVAGNAADLTGAVTTLPGLSIDPPPVVVSVSETPSSGDLGVGKTATLTLTLNDVVTVSGGIPSLSLNDGGVATYVGGSGTNALTFRYTVGAGDNTTALAATGLTLNGATIQNSLGDQAIFSFNGVTQTGPQVDTNTPAVTAVVASGAGITAGSGDIATGSVVTLTVDLTDAVTITGGTPTLTLNNGGAATYSAGSGTNALTFTYTVAPGQSIADLAVTAFNGGTATLKNGAGTVANMTGVTASISGTLEIDTSTHLAQVSNNYFLDNINNSGPTLKYNGAAVTVGQEVGWTPIGVVGTAGGYDVAWKNQASGLYTVWTTDSNGNYISNSVNVPGNSSTLENFETLFNQDLNGDGVIGTPPPPPPTIIQTDGSTSLVQAGNIYELNPVGGGTGPTLKYNGAAITVGQEVGWTPIGAIQTSTGYDVAWKNQASGLFTVWTTDSNGNYISNSVNVPGNSSTLENFETLFNQDLNGDGVIGTPPPPPPTIIQTDGSTSLVQAGNIYELNPVGGGTGPTLKYNGAAITVGQEVGWTPIGAIQTSTGYDVAWKNQASGLFTVWTTDSNGNYTSNSVNVPGNSSTLENFETLFNQDLNGDGVIGTPPPPPPTIIQTDGSTSLVQAGNIYELNPVGGGTGPTLKYNGAAITVGQEVGWTPIGAIQTSTGYDVAWKNQASGLFTVWTTDSNGNYISNSVNVPGNSSTLENFETLFNQDLNGDGVIGTPPPPPPTIIQTDGSTSLVQAGNIYELNPVGGGTGPTLKYNGAAITVGQEVGWSPIGAVETAGGYDVAWKNQASGLYTVWTTDSSGNYISNSVNVPGNNIALETFENTFQQDLNGDGVIGIYAAPGTTLQISSPLSGPSGSATIGAGATLELAAANSSSVTFNSSTGSLELDQPSTFNGVIFGFTGNGTLSGSDQIDLKGINFNTVHDSYSNGVLTVTDGTNSAALDLNGSYTLANFSFASDGKGGTILYDPPVTVGQAANLQPEIMQDPGPSALNQQLALFSQTIAAAFPSSAFGESASSTAGASELTGAQLSQLAAPIATQQHA